MSGVLPSSTRVAEEGHDPMGSQLSIHVDRQSLPEEFDDGLPRHTSFTSSHTMAVLSVDNATPCVDNSEDIDSDIKLWGGVVETLPNKRPYSDIDSNAVIPETDWIPDIFPQTPVDTDHSRRVFEEQGTLLAFILKLEKASRSTPNWKRAYEALLINTAREMVSLLKTSPLYGSVPARTAVWELKAAFPLADARSPEL